jgi:Cu(I)/Ag(I) efflux system membrane fusion protein/cobalt-zinc-cadmium efflux system membrane fusion protein
MTRNDNHLLRRWLGRLAWLGAGLLLAVLLILDPLRLHPIDSWLSGGPEPPVDTRPAAGSEELWTCGMHPHVLEDGPGPCPICGMAMVPVGPSARTGTAAAAASAEREILFYRNPMDPTISSAVPAKDEMGMEYVPVYADEIERTMGAGTTVEIDPAVVQNMNVRTATAERRDLRHDIRTIGHLEYDQGRMVTVTTKYSGWVERVYVNYVGEPVKRGQPLFEIYSPELVQTEQELLSAIEYAGSFAAADDARRRAEALVDAARTRLSYWGISAEQIARIEETGEIFRTLDVVAPASGLVMKRMPGLEGMAVKPGMEAYHIADLSSLWLSVEVFEDQVAWIGTGTPADVTFAYFPGETFRGTVSFLEPEFSEKTRTLRVKLEVPNPRRRLRAGMFATVMFQPVAAREALTVPSLSVLRTGQRNVVVVDLGGGRFGPREVVLGYQGAGLVEVIEGLSEGEIVVTSAQFLIDSEASLPESIQKMLAQRQGDDMPAGDEPAAPAPVDHSGH